MSLTLAISTSAGQFAMILGEKNKVLFDTSEQTELENTIEIISLLNRALGECKKTVSDISSIIVDIGPGGTSKVRTGVSFANALAYGMNLTVSPISSVELAGIHALAIYNLPVILSVKSIKGDAYIGVYNKGYIKIKHGNLAKNLPELVQDLDEFVVMGYHRQQIIDLFPDKKIIDSERRFGNARFLIEKIELLKYKQLKFPQISQPINEQSLNSY